jgi:hypothetical protein
MIRNYFCTQPLSDDRDHDNRCNWTKRQLQSLLDQGLVQRHQLKQAQFPYPEELVNSCPKRGIITYTLSEVVEPTPDGSVEDTPKVNEPIPETLDTKTVLFYFEKSNLDPLLVGAAKGMGLDPDQVVAHQLRKVVSQMMEEIFGEDRQGYLNDLLRAEIIRQVSH